MDASKSGWSHRSAADADGWLEVAEKHIHVPPTKQDIC